MQYVLGPKCTKGPKCNKPLVLSVISLSLHLRPNRAASSVIKVPKCNKSARCKKRFLLKYFILYFSRINTLGVNSFSGLSCGLLFERSVCSEGKII